MGKRDRAGRSTVAGHDRVAINVEVLERSMERSLMISNNQSKKNVQCTIYRVLHSIRRYNVNAYDPQIIAIGPFHRNKKALKPMEMLKWKYLQQLIERSPQNNTLQNYIDLVSNSIEDARSYYSEPVEPDDNAFVEMMVLDGCFLIEFLVRYYVGEELQFDEVKWNFPLLRNDILLLENQFPYPILKKLFYNSHIPYFDMDDETCVTLMDLVVCFINETSPKALMPNPVHHLLDVHHAIILLRNNSNQDQQASGFCHVLIKTIALVKTLPSLVFLWLLSSFLYCKIPLKCWGTRKSHPKKTNAKMPRAIPTAKQLQECGIKFEKEEAAKNILDAKFDKELGVMKIAKLAIQETTITEYFNLVAFEQCHPEAGAQFTSHAVLMNNLIDTAEDVYILKSNQIIESKLGHDEEVAKFFNRLCKGAYLNFETQTHKQLFMDVTEYCSFDRHKWRASLMHDYFGNPWSIIAMTVAAILLILTFLSTFYAIYAYYRPPS